MEVVTYSLKNGEGTSDLCYRDVTAFTGEYVAKAVMLYPIVEKLPAYLKEEDKWTVRSRDEYVFRHAMLGTLWCTYGDDAHSVYIGRTRIIAGLASLRQRGGMVKSVADSAPGIMATLFLSPVDLIAIESN
jgi:hypothetical protein